MPRSKPDLPGPLDRLVTLPPELPKLTLGWEAVKWASKYLRQPNGPKAGQRFEFTQSQVRFLLHWYGLDESGDWIYRRGVRRLSKGSGKSPFAALIALVEFCAPVRLDHWDENAPGGCVGKPVSMPWVVIAATTEAQTENTMRMVRAFAPKGSRVVADYGLEPGLTQYNKASGGKLHILTGSSSSAEGGEFTFAVGDEPEHWTPARNGPDFAATLADNLAKSGSRMLETCNSWEPGAGSVAEASWDSWVAQEEGKTRGESKILYDARVAPPKTVLHDDPDAAKGEVGLTEALRFVYDDCWWANLTAIKERIWDLQSLESDSRRKYLNQPVADERAWVTPQEWAALTDSTRVVADDEDIVLFFDGSKSRDATALVGCCMSDGYVFTVYTYEPNPKHDTEDVVPTHEVDSAVIAAHERYNVVAFFADVQEWQGFVKVTWPERYADNYVVMAGPSGREPAAIAWDMRSHSYEFAEAAEVCHEEIVSGRFRHDGNEVTARHIGNARNHPHKGRMSISKESPDSPRKIDAAVCVIGARMVRRLALAAAPKKVRTGESFFR
ncbi:MAG TPA: hypothetical protein VFH56_10990 [Acidimicrobiales bacterium]|nr:hypothetical protein [Acidimicrobiales bacterium]